MRRQICAAFAEQLDSRKCASIPTHLHYAVERWFSMLGRIRGGIQGIGGGGFNFPHVERGGDEVFYIGGTCRCRNVPQVKNFGGLTCTTFRGEGRHVLQVEHVGAKLSTCEQIRGPHFSSCGKFRASFSFARDHIGTDILQCNTSGAGEGGGKRERDGARLG